MHVSLWREGHYRRADDSTLLQAAAADGCILVTDDTSTVPLAAYQFLVDGMPFAGVVVLSSRIKQADIGGQRAAIMTELEGRPAQAWTNAGVTSGPWAVPRSERRRPTTGIVGCHRGVCRENWRLATGD